MDVQPIPDLVEYVHVEKNKMAVTCLSSTKNTPKHDNNIFIVVPHDLNLIGHCKHVVAITRCPFL